MPAPDTVQQQWRQTAEEMQFADIEAAIEGCRGLNRADTRAFFESHFPNVDYLAFHQRNHEIMAELLADGMPAESVAPMSPAHPVLSGTHGI